MPIWEFLKKRDWQDIALGAAAGALVVVLWGELREPRDQFECAAKYVAPARTDDASKAMDYYCIDRFPVTMQPPAKPAGK